MGLCAGGSEEYHQHTHSGWKYIVSTFPFSKLNLSSSIYSSISFLNTLIAHLFLFLWSHSHHKHKTGTLFAILGLSIHAITTSRYKKKQYKYLRIVMNYVYNFIFLTLSHSDTVCREAFGAMWCSLKETHKKEFRKLVCPRFTCLWTPAAAAIRMILTLFQRAPFSYMFCSSWA